MGWLTAYLAIEGPRQLRAETLTWHDLFGGGFVAFPWAVVGGAALTAALAVALVQAGAWLMAVIAPPPAPAPDDPDRRRVFMEFIVFAFLAGAVAIGLLTLALGLVGVGFPWSALGALIVLSLPAWALGGFAVVMALRAGARGRWRGRFMARPVPALPGAARVVVAFLMLWLAFLLLYALTPPIQSDGLRYHLAGPQEYLKAGRVLYLPAQAFTNFPFLAEMLFLLPMALGSDLAAKGAHWLFLLASGALVALLAGELGGRCGSESDRRRRGVGSALAALLFLTTPATAIVAAWAFTDLSVAAFFLAYVHALVRWTRGRERRWLVLAGIMGGGCLGVKYTMVPLVALGGPWVAAMTWVGDAGRPAESWRRGLWRLVALAAIVVLTGGAWFAKNAWFTGNPTYPMAWGVFGGSDWSAENADFYMRSALGKGYGAQIRENPAAIPGILARLPYDTAFRWRQNPHTGWQGFEDHNIGVGYLLLTPFLLAWLAWAVWRWRRDPASALVALFLIAYCVLWFGAYHSNRFLIPVLGLACACAGDLYRRLGQWQGGGLGVGRRLGRWIAMAMVVAAAHNAAWAFRWIVLEKGHPTPPMTVALGFMSREEYLLRSLPHYGLMAELSDIVGEGEGVLFIGEHRPYYCGVPMLISDWFDTPQVLTLIRETADNDALLDRLLADAVPYVFFNRLELGKYIAMPAFRERFTDGEWARFRDLLRDHPRLNRVRGGGDPLIYLSRIAPSPRDGR